MDKLRSRRGRRAAAALLCFAAAFASTSHAASMRGGGVVADNEAPEARPLATATATDDDGSSRRRRLSISLPHGGCQVTYAHISPIPIPPTWQASFPGSGARMTYMLVEALTGIRSNDDYNSHERGYENVVTVKTHYPVKDARRKFGQLDPLFERAIVILRNPINAIPSYFNLQYEHEHKLPNHSTRGPNKDWLAYREHPGYGVFEQLRSYERFVEYWMERYADRSNLLMVSYEDLTSDQLGPIVAQRIANFLGRTQGVDPVAPESVPCVWETVVNYKKHAEESAIAAGGGDAPPPDATGRGRRERALRKIEVEGVMVPTGRTHADPSSLRTGPKVRPYSEEQLGGMVDMFHRLREKYQYDDDLIRILSSYIEMVSKTPIEEGEDGL